MQTVITFVKEVLTGQLCGPVNQLHLVPHLKPSSQTDDEFVKQAPLTVDFSITQQFNGPFLPRLRNASELRTCSSGPEWSNGERFATQKTAFPQVQPQ